MLLVVIPAAVRRQMAREREEAAFIDALISRNEESRAEPPVSSDAS